MFDIGIMCVSFKALFELRAVVFFSAGLSFIIIRYSKFVTKNYSALTLLIFIPQEEGSKQHKEQRTNTHASKLQKKHTVV